MSHIIRCPFCGSSKCYDEFSNDSGNKWVACKDCQGSGPIRRISESDAIAAWNSRCVTVVEADKATTNTPQAGSVDSAQISALIIDLLLQRKTYTSTNIDALVERLRKLLPA